MYCACAMPEPAKMTSTATAKRPGVITRSCSSPADCASALRRDECRRQREGEPRHLVALETHPEDRPQQVAARRHVGTPGRKDDHVIGALFADEAKDALLALAAV